MKILIVNYFSKPVTGAHVYRWSQLSDYWASLGYDVWFLTSKSGAVQIESHDDVRYIRVGINKIRAEGCEPTGAVQISYKKNIIKLLKFLRRKVFWPDGYWGWLPFLLKKIFHLRNQDFDLVVTYSPSFCAHIAGLAYKRIFGGRGFWIADYGDPFSVSISMPPNNFRVYDRLNRFVEKMVLKSANKTVFTNESTRLEYVKCFGDENFKVIPHAVDINAFYSLDSFRKGMPRIFYIGGFHRNIREPDLMLNMMNMVGERLGLYTEVYGPLNGFSSDELCADFVKYKGSINREEAIALSRSNCILINVENSNCVMTPSKVVEAVATGNPIINFYKLQKTKLLLDERLENNVIHVNSLDLVGVVMGFIKCRMNNKLSLGDVNDILVEHSIHSVSSKYIG